MQFFLILFLFCSLPHSQGSLFRFTRGKSSRKYNPSNSIIGDPMDSIIPRFKIPYRWKNFITGYEVVFREPMPLTTDLKVPSEKSALKLMDYFTSYYRQFQRVIPLRVAVRIFQFFLGNDAIYSGNDIQSALKKLGQKKSLIFANIINDAIASHYSFPYFNHLTNDSCEWIPLLEFFPMGFLSIITLVEVARKIIDGESASDCKNRLLKLIHDQLSFILPLGSYIDIVNVEKTILQRLQMDPRASLYYKKEDKKKLINVIQRVVDPVDPGASKEMCFNIIETWQSGMKHSYSSCGGRVKESSYEPYNNTVEPKFAPLLVKKGDRSRSSPALVQIAQADNRRQERLYRLLAVHEFDGVYSFQLEDAFNKFISSFPIKGEQDRYCIASKELAKKKNILPLWNGLAKHYVPVEEVVQTLCDTQDNYLRRYKRYQRNYADRLYFVSNNRGIANLPTIRDESIAELKQLKALGLFITDCMMYDFQPLIEKLMAAGVTINEFLELNELHFFILDASPKMLLFFIEKIEFASITADYAYYLWKQILTSSMKFTLDDEKKFFNTLFARADIKCARSEDILVTVEELIKLSNKGLPSFPIQSLVKKYVLLKESV